MRRGRRPSGAGDHAFFANVTVLTPIPAHLEELRMGRSKEMGKPVEQLSIDELRREHSRCRTLVQVYGRTKAGKGLFKRLLQIEKRMESERPPVS